MAKLRIILQDQIAISELARILDCLSELYRILALAYGEQAIPVHSQQVLPAYNRQDISGSPYLEEEIQKPWSLIQDLHLSNASSGSIVIDLVEKVKKSQALEKLVEWVKNTIDPYHRRRSELDIRKHEYELEAQKKLDERDITKKDLDIAKEGIDIIMKACEMHDKLIASNFPEQVAKNAFYKAIGCVAELRKIQEKNSSIISLEILQTELTEKEERE